MPGCAEMSGVKGQADVGRAACGFSFCSDEVGLTPTTHSFLQLRCRRLSQGADMRRREFLGLVGGAATWPVTASGQQPEQLRRIGVLTQGSKNTHPAPPFGA